MGTVKKNEKIPLLIYPEEGDGALRSIFRNQEFVGWIFSQVR
ncbi:MAG: hypothetical protein P1U85_08160 [Verrucomicrobiales bacterium]|nr:hypothetical protein [Verrucomicrobiales bacterium]